MSEMKIDYHAACPSCGAVNQGRDVCEYCGASLVKSVIQRSGNGFMLSDEEMRNEQEDMSYESIRGSLTSLNWAMIIFLGLFGGMFMGIPAFMLLMFILTGAAGIFPILFLGSFMLIGAIPIFLVFQNIVNHGKCKNGEEISGEVRGYSESMVLVNGRPLLEMRVLIRDEGRPKILILSIHQPDRPYPIGKTVRMKRYKNNYMMIE